MLAFLGVAALILGFILKRVDRKKGYGLELPNIKKESDKVMEETMDGEELA